MFRARSVLAVLVGSLVACTSLSGIDDLELETKAAPAPVGPDAHVDPTTHEDASTHDASVDARLPDLPPGPPGWAYRRPITLRSDLPESPATYPVLVRLPASFDYAKAKADGADLRFSRTDEHGDDLPYWIERWAPNEESAIWVLVPTLPAALSTLHLFYGNANATAVSRFEDVFARVRQTAGGGAGSFDATEDIDVDWFELRAGDTITLAAGKPLKITARRIILSGNVKGDAKGWPAGLTVADPHGKGPGGGRAKQGSGGGGGGYGGAGGAGGADSGEGGASGAANGSETTVDMGSGGGLGFGIVNFRPGGAGGGAISLLGWSTNVRGTISVSGASAGSGAGQNGGGGAGGGILIGGSFLDLAGAHLNAKGGAGGNTVNEGSDGGGGGGGGRINVHARETGFYAAASMDVSFGAGGTGASTTAPGRPGSLGVKHVNTKSNLLPGVETTVGAETTGY